MNHTNHPHNTNEEQPQQTLDNTTRTKKTIKNQNNTDMKTNKLPKRSPSEPPPHSIAFLAASFELFNELLNSLIPCQCITNFSDKLQRHIMY